MAAPRKFKSPEEFEILAESYFAMNKGKKISWTGLCLAVGVTSREALQNYRHGKRGPEFVEPVKRALLRVQQYYEEEVDGAKGIFVMKNFGWKDKQEHEVKADMSVNIDKDSAKVL